MAARSSRRKCCSRSTRSATGRAASAIPTASVKTPDGFPAAYKQMSDDGWMAMSADPAMGRAGPSARRLDAVPGDVLVGQHGVLDVSGPDARRCRGDPGRRIGRAEEDLPAQHDDRQMVGHHEPDRAAVRHGSGPDPHQGGSAAGRQLQDHRPEDLDLRRRAGPRREHHPARAGAHRGRAGRHQGHLALHRAEVHGQRGWLAGRAQRVPVRRPRREDGHPRQRDLRDEL